MASNIDPRLYALLRLAAQAFDNKNLGIDTEITLYPHVGHAVVGFVMGIDYPDLPYAGITMYCPTQRDRGYFMRYADIDLDRTLAANRISAA